MLKRVPVAVKIAGGAVLVVGAIVSVTYEEHRATDKYQRVCQEQVSKVPPGSGKEDAASAKKCDDPKDYMPWWYKLIAWPDGIGGWALIATGLVIAWQSYETHEAAKATRASVQIIIDKERARLRIDMKPLLYEAQSGPGRRLQYSIRDIEGLRTDETRVLIEANDRPYADACEYHHGTPPDSIGPEVAYLILQDGETSAFIESAVADVQIRDTDLVRYEDAFTLISLPKVIKSGAEPLERYALIFPILTGDVLEDVKAKRKFIHFYGVIRYKDVFKQTRETGFYYTWHITSHPARPHHHPDNWVKRRCPGYDQET